MSKKIKTLFGNTIDTKRIKDIEPDEIFLDSENLPKFDVNQFEGRIEKSISTGTFLVFGIVCALIFGIFFARSIILQGVRGAAYLAKSESNRLRYTVLFPERGIITDRNDEKLAWNSASDTNSEFSFRTYKDTPGLSHAVGYVQYPSKDASGFYYNEDFLGEDGVEKYYNDVLSGTNGQQIIEIDAAGKLSSESVVRPPEDGTNLKLSIDAGLTSFLYQTIRSLAQQVGFTGGGGVIMDVHTGEVIALTSFPEYDSQVMTDRANKKIINQYLTDSNNPFLDRIIDGLYTPGSIVKPYMAFAALTEKIIDPLTTILSTGSISIPNPYDPAHPSVFRDWRPQGYVDVRHALAVSSDVYFYEVGGGYQNQKGLGINLIDTYMNMFGFGNSLPDGFFKGSIGVIPTPDWKKANFNGEEWNIGDTYHTSIGQYGFQVTPMQVVRAVAAIANGGTLVNPSILFGGDAHGTVKLDLDQNNLQIVREGMSLSASAGGVASGLDVGYVKVGAKTGTAELGSKKQFVNSWVTGFFPYDHPKYAFAVIMEKGPVTNTVGGVYVMRQVLDWLHATKPDYLSSN